MSDDRTSGAYGGHEAVDASVAAMQPERLIEGQPLKVLLIDDHQLIREGLKLMLARLDPLTIVLEADSLPQAVDIYRRHDDIDLVLLDLSMPGSYSGQTLDTFVEACPSSRVVVVSATCDTHTVQATLRKGALGFIPKLTDARALVQALRFVLEGGIYVPLEVLSTGQAVRPEPPVFTGYMSRADVPALTQRQMDVLRELLEGKSNKQICRDLNMAMGTVKSHLASVFAALRVNSRTEAIAAAERMGWRIRLQQVCEGDD